MLGRPSTHLFINRSWPGTVPTLLAPLAFTHASSSLWRQVNSRIVHSREPAMGAEAYAIDRLKRVNRTVEHHASRSQAAAQFEMSASSIAQ